ncbi:MAG: S-layer homology domain-containing protein [Oscillospiraceae bacterium]|nr:S-layer homology domain-containing protein [Oscillospiraceae bacterium]
MKQLSRVLSLALVIALSLSLIVVAGAKNVGDYPDADKIAPQYVEAVDVLTALGVFQGDESGSLGPQSTFTRAQAAKIVTYISIGTTAADKLTHRASSFTDVATDHWANPFIEYAVEKGIVNGVGGNRFDPETPVTGSQFAKLMLTALGYGAKGEYVGASWELNAIVDGQKHGILTGDADYSEPATREQAIQYTFNTINPGIVGISKNFLVKFSSIINDYVLANGSAYAIGDTGSAQWLGEETFGLVRDSDEDDYGFTGHYWVVGPKRISETFYKDGVVIAELISSGMISKGYLYSTYEWADTLSEVWTNGYLAASVASGTYVVKGDTLSPAFGGTGWSVTLLDMTFDGKVDKIVISYGYLAKVTKIDALAGTVTADFYYRNGAAKAERAVKVDGTGYVVGDYIVITPINDAAGSPILQASSAISSVLSVEKAVAVTGRATGYATDKSFFGPGYITSITVDGTTYFVASVEALTYNTEGLSYDADVILYLDSNNYIIGYEGASVTAASLNYLYITEGGAGGGNWSNNSIYSDRRLAVVYADGTRAVVEAALKSNGDWAGANATATAGKWYSYTFDSNGKIILAVLPSSPAGAAIPSTPVAYSVTAAADYSSDSTKGFAITTGNPRLTVGASVTVPVAGDAINKITAGYATSGTILRIGGRTYTGYRNFPSYLSINGDSVLVVFAQSADRSPTTTIAAIYVATTSASVKSGEYGIIMLGFTDGSTPTGWRYTVMTKTAPEGEPLIHPDDFTTAYVMGTVVEIVTAADGTRTVGEAEALLGYGVIEAVDGDYTYIRVGGNIYYLASDVLFYDGTEEGASKPKEGDIVLVYGAAGNTSSNPAFAVYKSSAYSAFAPLQTAINSATAYRATLTAFTSGTLSFDGALTVAKTTLTDLQWWDIAASTANLNAAVAYYQAGLAAAKLWRVGDITEPATGENRTDVVTAIGNKIDTDNTAGYLATTDTYSWINDTNVTVKFADATTVIWTLANAHTA